MKTPCIFMTGALFCMCVTFSFYKASRRDGQQGYTDVWFCLLLPAVECGAGDNKARARLPSLTQRALNTPQVPTPGCPPKANMLSATRQPSPHSVSCVSSRSCRHPKHMQSATSDLLFTCQGLSSHYSSPILHVGNSHTWTSSHKATDIMSVRRPLPLLSISLIFYFAGLRI